MLNHLKTNLIQHQLRPIPNHHSLTNIHLPRIPYNKPNPQIHTYPLQMSIQIMNHPAQILKNLSIGMTWTQPNVTLGFVTTPL